MDLGYPADHDFSDICGKFNNFLINFDACLDETTEEGAKWKDSTGTHFDRVLLMRMHTNLMDEQIYLNVEKDWNKLWNFFKLVPIQIQRRGLRGFSKPKIEGFAVPKTVNYPGLAAFTIATNNLAERLNMELDFRSNLKSLDSQLKRTNFGKNKSCPLGNTAQIRSGFPISSVTKSVQTTYNHFNCEILSELSFLNG